jgi:hypothetical protein
MATLDGFLVFGDAVMIQHQLVPRDYQRREHIDPVRNGGLEDLDQCHSITTTTITGRVHGSTPGDVANWIGALWAFDDGQTHVLVDNEGTTWPAAKFDGLQLDGRGVLAGGYGYTRRYTLKLRHLAGPATATRDWLRP